MDETLTEEADANIGAEVAPALIAVHPAQNFVAVAVGPDLRVFDLIASCPVSLSDETGEHHKDSIRAICYGSKGKLFVSAGDDKIVKIWWTESWRCICNVFSEKRVSAVAISPDGLHVCFADKFGVIWVVDLEEGIDVNQSLANKKAVPLLSHYCSIITSLEFSPDGRFIVSADRDFKIRVTLFPRNPLDGAHEIQSFCLGHTDFVSCLAFISNTECPHGFLISGSGDSTVRLWEIISGSLLDTCKIEDKVELLESEEKEGCHSAITSLCKITDVLLAVATQSLHGIMLLNCDLSDHRLSVLKVVSIRDETFVPTSLASSFSSGLLWTVTGVSSLHNLGRSLARVKVISVFRSENPDSTGNESLVQEDDLIPGGKQLLEKLQGSVCFEEKVFLAAAEAVKNAMSNLLTKKQYSTEKRDLRKRSRNDRKLKQ